MGTYFYTTSWMKEVLSNFLCLNRGDWVAYRSKGCISFVINLLTYVGILLNLSFIITRI